VEASTQYELIPLQTVRYRKLSNPRSNGIDYTVVCFKPKFHYAHFHRTSSRGKAPTQTISTCRDGCDRVRDKCATNPSASLKWNIVRENAQEKSTIWAYDARLQQKVVKTVVCCRIFCTKKSTGNQNTVEFWQACCGYEYPWIYP